MRTALLCPVCGKRCGSGEVLAEDRDVVHVTMFKGWRRGSSGLRMHVTRGRTLRLSDPDGWPLTWRCDKCPTAIVVDRQTARRIGGERQIVVSMPSDN